MRFTFLIIPSVLIFQVALAQNSSTSAIQSPETTTLASAAASGPEMAADPKSSPGPTVSSPTTPIAIMDYKSVYETATVEDEVKMAAERYNLTPAQQDIWLTAAADRREVEKQAREKLDSKASNYEKDPVYRGLKSAQNTFYETIIGYLSPAQKNALEADRQIMAEKQRRLAKLPPPAPPAPTVTVAPVDSVAIKQAENDKKTSKKSKKKKKAVIQ